jgi:hypothetical protein
LSGSPPWVVDPVRPFLGGRGNQPINARLAAALLASSLACHRNTKRLCVPGGSLAPKMMRMSIDASHKLLILRGDYWHPGAEFSDQTRTT